MPSQEANQTIRNTFVKGLITEASELNFPSEASIDELNCSLFKAGNRARRLGLEYETDNQLSDRTYPSLERLYGIHKWINVGGNPDIEFVVVQTQALLLFYQKNSGALSGEPVPVSKTDSSIYRVDLNDFKKPGGIGAGQSHIEVASINGRLVVVSPQIEPFYIERNETTEAFTETQINFRVRDFEYQTEDREVLTELDTTFTPSVERQYDTRNCGWSGDKGHAALTTWFTTENYYPPLTHPWYSGKDSSGNFSITEWKEVYSGNTLIVNGHYILDLFDKDRSTASGIVGIPKETTTDRFTAVASFAGRIFYAGVGSKVYFSRLLDGMYDVGNLYQVNDPTSELASDLLDTDGGFLDIPEASGIKKLHMFGATLLVFADNGVWRVSGVDGVFRATEYSVYKITDEGLAQRTSFVSGTNSVPFWWSYNGIHTVQVTDDGGIVEENLTRETIQTFWDNIEGSAKAFVQGAYDGLADRVSWFYPNNGETLEYKLNNVLLLDLPLGAFYPWKVSDTTDVDGPHILGAVFTNSSGADDVEFTVVDNDGNTVVNSLGDTVVATLSAGVISSSALKVLVRDADGYLTFAEFTSTDFLDWGTADYSSYAEGSYNFIGDLGRRKNSPYITTFCRVTETGWEVSGNGYTPTRNSSMLVSTYWDFRNIPSSTAQQAYRFKYPLVVNTGALTTFTYPQDVIVTRLKTRGRGRVMRVRFESEQGKDFNLLGWETLDTRNATY